MKDLILREGPPESVGMDPVRIQKVRDLLADWVNCGDTPSVVALVARRGVVVLHEAFGMRHYEDTTPTLKLDSIFPIASITKPLTAAAIMSLVEDGLIGLNRPFVDYVPELDLPEVEGIADAKIADLLCHTAGIDDVAVGQHIASAAERATDLPAAAPGQHPKLNWAIRLAAGAPLARRPGSACIYSVFTYNLLSDIVRRVSGQPFEQFLQSRLFGPLGMKDTHLVFPAALRERRVYRAPGLPGTEPGLLHRGLDSVEHDEIAVGGGTGLSTARDLAVFLQMILNRGSYGGHRILSPASVAAMTRVQVDRSIPMVVGLIDRTTGKRVLRDVKPRSGFGFGFYIAGDDRFAANGSLLSQASILHLGNGGACVWADLERELVGILLSISPRYSRAGYTTNSDLFQNAIHAAIID